MLRKFLLYAAISFGILSLSTIASTLPRHGALRSSKINLHVGPGQQYPVDWVLVCKNLPVMIMNEFGQWRRIRLFDGTTGWVHKSLLSQKPTSIIVSPIVLRQKSVATSAPIVQLSRGVVVELLKKRKQWVQVVVHSAAYGKIIGWIPQQALWGAWATD